MTTYYTKQGRRYVPAIHAEPWGYDDAMKPGQARLVTCAPDGMRRYSYDVTPDAAAVIAALDLAELAMMEAMDKASVKCKVMDHVGLPPKCRELADELAAELTKARVAGPPWWKTPAISEIAKAARKVLEDAVKSNQKPAPAETKIDYDDVGKGPWRYGPPPSVGWWPASVGNNQDTLRWWDGSTWSWCSLSRKSSEAAAKFAAITALDSRTIRWRDRADWWPERSRT